MKLAAFVIVTVVATAGCAQLLGISPPGSVDGGSGGAATIARTSGDSQSGTAGSPLAAPFVVTVEDGTSQPVANVTVDFVVTSGGGNVSVQSSPTDAEGRAQTTLTLGTTAGANSVEARAGTLTGSPVVFSATGLAGPATQIALTSGQGQSGTAGSALSAPFVVTARDPHENPVAGLTVDFVVTSGGGSVSVPSAMTDAQGQAQATLTLGASAGPNEVEARVTGLSGSPVGFMATGVVGPAAQIVSTSGNGQSGTAGTALAAPFVVTVEDAGGNPVPNITVAFVRTGGGGSVSVPAIATDAQGQAATTLTLGAMAGPNTVEARAGALSGSPVVFTATGLAGSATQLVSTSGQGQSGTAGSALASPFVVAVRDANNNPVAGVTVDFVRTAGGGSLSVPSAPTDAQGQAQTTLTLGTVVGTNTVEARATGLSGSPVTFTATGLTGPATQLVSTSGNGQFGAIGTLLDAPFVVTVEDANHNAVPGVAVGFVVVDGGGSVSAPSVMTDAQGHAQATLTLGSIFVTNTVEVSATGLSGSPLQFTATPVGFAAKVDFTTGTSPFSVAVGDFNGDTKLDLAVVNSSTPGTVSVFLNTTAAGAMVPTFAARVDFPTGGAPTFVAVGDLNGDGKPDLAVANEGPGSVSVLLNTTAMGATTPSFAAKVDFTTGPQPTSIAIGDFNKDDKLDLAVAGIGANSVSILLNTAAVAAATPAFATKVDFSTGLQPISVAAGDVDGDGKLDLALANRTSNTVSILRNTTTAGATTPSFATKVDFPTGMGPGSIAIGDVNGDSKPDLVVANRTDGTVSVLLDNTSAPGATPSFAAKVDFPTGMGSISVAIGDLSGDGSGKLDLAVANFGETSVSVLCDTTATGASVPSYTSTFDFTAGLNPTAIAIGDFNGDGKLDLAVTNQTDTNVSILLRR